MIIARRVVISRPIFSPLSGGKLKPSMVMNEIRTQGKIRLNTK